MKNIAFHEDTKKRKKAMNRKSTEQRQVRLFYLLLLRLVSQTIRNAKRRAGKLCFLQNTQSNFEIWYFTFEFARYFFWEMMTDKTFHFFNIPSIQRCIQRFRFLWTWTRALSHRFYVSTSSSQRARKRNDLITKRGGFWLVKSPVPVSISRNNQNGGGEAKLRKCN